MLDKVKGLQLLDDTILNNKTHQDYKRVTELAQEYYDIFTGANIDKHLRRISTRESEEMFKQRCRIFNSTIPSTVENLSGMFDKPLRSNRIFSSVDHTNTNARNEIVDRMSKFYQGESESGIDAYLYEKWKHLVIYDPNAFICIEFGNFNPVTDKAYPFPLEYTSQQAINYSYINGTLDWLIAKLPIKYRTDAGNMDATADGSKYIMYLQNSAIVLTQVDKDKQITDKQNPEFHAVSDKKGIIQSVYVIEYFDTKSQIVPLRRVGYKSDPVTSGRTCLSIIHASLAFFKKELKTGSEFDLTMSLHAFPVRVQWGKPCEGDKTKGITCVGGKTASGQECPVCKGNSMIPIATSTQDIIYVRPPKTPNDPVLDLSKAFVYITPPVDFIKFQEDYLSRLSEKAKAAVFASEPLQKKTADVTATEMDYSYDNVYDVYHPYGRKYSDMWMFIVRMIAIYTDNNTDGLNIYHQFPKDYKLKGVATLLNEAKLASESGLSQHVIMALNNDILDNIYSDDQDTLTKIRIKDKFHPFSGKSTAEIQSILMGDVLPYYKTLYTYFDIIFSEIDNTLGDKFYLMSYANQKSEVDKRVNDIINTVEQSKAKRLGDMLAGAITQPQ